MKKPCGQGARCRACEKGLGDQDAKDQFGLCADCLVDPKAMGEASDKIQRDRVARLAGWLEALVAEDWDQPIVHDVCAALGCSWQELASLARALRRSSDPLAVDDLVDAARFALNTLNTQHGPRFHPKVQRGLRTAITNAETQGYSGTPVRGAKR